MKRLLSVLILIVFICSFSIVSLADENEGNETPTEYYNILDTAELLPMEDRLEILDRIDAVSKAYNYDVLIETWKDAEGDLSQTADYVYDYCDYGGTDGNAIMLFVDQASNQYIVKAYGKKTTVFNDSNIGYISNIIANDVANKDYYKAFWKFANMCDVFLKYDDIGESFTPDDYADFFMPYVGNQVPSKRILNYLEDHNDLIADSQEEDINNRLEELSLKHKCDIAVVTVYSLKNRTSMEYADDYFDYNGFGYETTQNGIVLLISMENRDYWLSTCGTAINNFSDAGIDYISNRLIPYMKDGDFEGCVNEYITQCDSFLTSAENGSVLDVKNLPKPPKSNSEKTKEILYAVIFGLIMALILSFRLKAQLKTVNYQPDANNYLRPGSFNLVQSNDIFLYTNVTKTAIPKDNGGSGGSSSHSSSSGSSHGGGGGHF